MHAPWGTLDLNGCLGLHEEQQDLPDNGRCPGGRHRTGNEGLLGDHNLRIDAGQGFPLRSEVTLDLGKKG